MAAYERELARIVEQLNKAATGTPQRDRPEEPPAGADSLDELLAVASRRQATDILLVAGSPVVFRVDGALAPASGPPLGAEEVRSLLLPLLTPDRYADLQKRRSLDFGLARGDAGRTRVNVHFQRGTLAATIRLLPTRVPSLESLHLPSSVGELIDRRQGLVLVTGPAGCGKTTTLAALVDRVNRQRRAHILTIEDPIEYEHTNHLSVIEQIEVGADTPDFAGAVRSVLRQTPDVILVGEMRDAETMATVLTAAETGHLVLSTLHTNDTPQAVSRILDSFPEANQPQIRQQFSLALLAVIAQQLIPAADGRGRLPALEILVATDAVRNLIRRGQDHQLRTQLLTGRAAGMITMEQSLAALVRSGKVSVETARAHCYRPDDLAGHLEAR